MKQVKKASKLSNALYSKVVDELKKKKKRDCTLLKFNNHKKQ